MKRNFNFCLNKCYYCAVIKCRKNISQDKYSHNKQFPLTFSYSKFNPLLYDKNKLFHSNMTVYCFCDQNICYSENEWNNLEIPNYCLYKLEYIVLPEINQLTQLNCQELLDANT